MAPAAAQEGKGEERDNGGETYALRGDDQPMRPNPLQTLRKAGVPRPDVEPVPPTGQSRAGDARQDGADHHGPYETKPVHKCEPEGAAYGERPVNGRADKGEHLPRSGGAKQADAPGDDAYADKALSESSSRRPPSKIK